MSKDLICWCTCYSKHGVWNVTIIKHNISCNECVELCTKENAKHFEYHCRKLTPPPEEEVDYGDEGFPPP
jgi:hypothetical protein